jgi:hypothetical protein
VPDTCDLCPGTAFGAQVDGNGCPTVQIPGDFNGDGDVDGGDFAAMWGCMTGADNGPPDPGCEDKDLDIDLDIDQKDFGILQQCLSGESIAGDPDCAG